MVVRNLIVVIISVVMLVRPPLAYATVASGAVTARNVFALSVSGAAKVAAAELTVANALRVLGLLGRVAGTIGLAWALYDIAANTWDWWNQSYDAGTAGIAATGTGSWGVTGDVTYSGPFKCTDGFNGAGDVIPSFVTVVGRSTHSSSASFGGAHGTCSWYDVHVVTTSTLPSASVSPVLMGGATNRSQVVSAIDGALSDLSAATSTAVGGIALSAGTTYNDLISLLTAARSIVSGGVALTPSDYAPGSGFGSGSASLPGNGIPAAVAGGSENTVAPTQNPPSTDMSGVTSAVNAASAAITSAIAASQAAVVSAVQAIPAAITASGAAVVSAVQSVAAPIVAAISASQAAIVSAVNSVVTAVSGVTSHVDDVKTAVQGVQSSTDAVKSSVDALKAQEAAQDQAATDKAASSATPAFTCPVCTRQDKWNDFWVTLKEAGMAAPVFGLISKLVINPSAGTGACAVRTISTSRMGSFTIDPSVWNCSTLVAVFRFAILGTCVIVAYMILFG